MWPNDELNIPVCIHMVKVDNRNTRTRYFTPCSSVSIVNFEQLNAGWDILLSIEI